MERESDCSRKTAWASYDNGFIQKLDEHPCLHSNENKGKCQVGLLGPRLKVLLIVTSCGREDIKKIAPPVWAVHVSYSEQIAKCLI